MILVTTMSDTEQLSALMDGELDEVRAVGLLNDMTRDHRLKKDWERYHLISDVLSNNLQPMATSDLMGRVRVAVNAEPLPPRAARSWMGIFKPAAGFALAASVAVVAVLGFRAVTEQPGTPATSVAQKRPPGVDARLAGMRWNVDKPAVEAKLNGFLVNHSGYAGKGVQGMLPYARIVGYDAGGR